MKKVYLDYAAATPLDPEALAAMQPYLADNIQNPSGLYLSARAVRHDLEAARGRVAVSLGVRPAEIVFTAGATEANNLAIQGVMNRFPEGEALVSAIEHESVLAPARQFKVTQIPVDKQGLVILNKLSNLINDQTVLISVGLVNNELGVVQPLREISTWINQVRKARLSAGNKLPLYLHTDAAQAGNCLDLHVSRLGVDLLSLNGGKIYGPKHSGALYVKAGLSLEPIIYGGGQEGGLRSGTENVANYVGLAAALSKAQRLRASETKRINELRLAFEAGLENYGAIINGPKKYRAPHISNVTFSGADNERLMMQLDEAGFEVATGSACSVSSEQPSHVLAAIGLPEAQIRSSLRFSFGRQTTIADINMLLKTLVKFL